MNSRTDRRAGPRRSFGFSLLEIQIAAILAVVAFGGLAMLLSMESNHLRWAESRGYTQGAETDFGVVSVAAEVIISGASLTGVYFVEMKGCSRPTPDSLQAILRRRDALDTDCGRPP